MGGRMGGNVHWHWKNAKLRRGVIAASCLSVLAALSSWYGLHGPMEQETLDWRYRHFNRNSHAASEVLVLDIDESSRQLITRRYGHWPWPRAFFRDLTAFLSLGDPTAIY